MKFKVGDKVKCTKKPSIEKWQLDENPIGKIYIVSMTRNDIIKVKNQERAMAWYSIDLFMKLNEPKTETEFLDAFQINEREGY